MPGKKLLWMMMVAGFLSSNGCCGMWDHWCNPQPRCYQPPPAACPCAPPAPAACAPAPCYSPPPPAVPVPNAPLGSR